MQNIQQALDKLDHSKFRSSFHLTKKEKEYLEEKGKQVIESHARDFVKLKLSAADPINDGKQTPMKGHPVFKADRKSTRLNSSHPTTSRMPSSA